MPVMVSSIVTGVDKKTSVLRGVTAEDCLGLKYHKAAYPILLAVLLSALLAVLVPVVLQVYVPVLLSTL